MLTRWNRFVRLIGLVVLSLVSLISCQNNLVTNASQEIVLCGRTNNNSVHVYHVSILQEGAVVLKQVIDLPGSDLRGAGACPQWLTGGRFAWLYGNTTNGYQRDVYLLDLDRGQTKKWFHLSSDDDVEDITLISSSPMAVIVSSRDQDNACSQYTSAEGHWTCLYTHGDLYIVDEQGKTERLTHNQSPLCQATWRPDGRTVAFSQAKGCIGPAPDEPSKILLVDVRTTQIESFEDNQDTATPLWSPDGKYLAFLKQSSLPYILDLGNNRVVPLAGTPSGQYRQKLAWSPDSLHLAWEAIPDNVPERGVWEAQVGVFDVARQTAVRFPNHENSVGSARSPQWSPDGKGLSWESGSALYFGNIENSSMYSVSVGVARMLDWSFDGKAVTYIGSSPQNPNQVFVMSKDGKDIIDLADKLSLKDVQWLQVNGVRR